MKVSVRSKQFFNACSAYVDPTVLIIAITLLASERSERAQSCSCSIEISDTYVYIYIYIYIYVIVINRTEVYSGVIRTEARGR